MSIANRYATIFALGALVGSLSAHAACPAGQEMLDGKSCVALTPWNAKTPLPDGTQLAIKLRTVMRDYQGNSQPWPRWVGLSGKDGTTLAAFDDTLQSRDVFKVKMYMPAGAQYYDLPWFIMQASNGKFVAAQTGGTGGLGATIATEADADLFGRYWNSPAQWGRLSYKWKDRDTYLNQVKKQGHYYILCLSPFNVAGTMDGAIGQWLSGPAPNYGCYKSAEMDYYVVGAPAAIAPPPPPAQAACAAGQEQLDGKTCVSATAWNAKTPLPDGTQLAIKLRTVMRDYQGNSQPWPRWVGLSAKDGTTLAAFDDKLQSRDIFKVKMYMPAGAQYYDLPWFIMQASNGKFVAAQTGGTGGLGATIATEADADLFGRYWNSPAQWGRLSYKWKDRETYLNQVKTQGHYYILCLSPFNVAGTMDGAIGQWLSGPAPNYGCYKSAEMDYYIIK